MYGGQLPYEPMLRGQYPSIAYEIEPTVNYNMNIRLTAAFCIKPSQFLEIGLLVHYSQSVNDDKMA